MFISWVMLHHNPLIVNIVLNVFILHPLVLGIILGTSVSYVLQIPKLKSYLGPYPVLAHHLIISLAFLQSYIACSSEFFWLALLAHYGNLTKTKNDPKFCSFSEGLCKQSALLIHDEKHIDEYDPYSILSCLTSFVGFSRRKRVSSSWTVDSNVARVWHGIWKLEQIFPHMWCSFVKF